MAHEIHHAYEYIMGTIRGISPYVGRNPPWEAGALRAENEVRRFYGIKEKKNYTEDVYSWMPGLYPVLMLETFKVEVRRDESEE